MLGLLLLIYTAFVYITSPGDLFGWFNTLISTALSVLFALLVGLVLFAYQTQETDRKKKEELEELLKTELGEVRRVIETARTVVPDEALETTGNFFTSHELQYVFRYTHPLNSGRSCTERALRHRTNVGDARSRAQYEATQRVCAGGHDVGEIRRKRSGCLRRSILPRAPEGQKALRMGLA
jgi:hypothetical protein